jgi:tetratricopeptide (TPR) repeat protein
VGCLNDAEVLDLVEGNLAPAAEAAAKRHLDSCDDCRALVAETARSIVGPGAEGRLARSQTVGRYLILDVVGAGATGVVYAAYDPELDRKVALKLLATGGPSGAAGDRAGRLLREAQAMARLSHPGVVAVHDTGTTADGQVFVVMEFVAGGSLRSWLAAARRPWREVLLRYVEAGEGLAAAHRAGLVHRDFKPDNVMVGTDGRARVTDFGLARAVERAAGAAAGETGAGAARPRVSGIAGTPAYMAPEVLGGDPATERSDQFSFCVALYEGLYGEAPFPGDSFTTLRAAVQRGQVRDAPRGATVPARLRAVLLRGLRPDPDARFPSMDALLRALQSVRYRTRRRVVYTLVAAVVALLAILGTREARQARLVCSGAERHLVGVWDPARKQAAARAFARTGVAYAADAWRGAERALDQYTSAWVAMRTDACEATRVRGEQSADMLDRRVECLDGHLRQVAALTRLLADADAEVVARAVEAATALPSLADCQNADALRAGVHLPRDQRTAARVQALRVTLAQVKALEEAGKYREARTRAEAVLVAAREVRYLPLEAEALGLAGQLAGRLGDITAAESKLHAAAEAALAAGHDAIAARAFIDLINLVGLNKARYAEAHQWARYAQLAIERLGGSDEREADRLEAVSGILWKEGKHEASIAVLRRALSLYRKVLGADHVKVARALDGIATAYFEQGKLQEAYELDRQALDIAERALGPSHPRLNMFLNNIGNTLALEGRYDEGLRYLHRALDLSERTFGRTHPDTVAPLDTIGSVLTVMGRPAEALPYLERARANLEQAGQGETPDYAAVLNDRGAAELALGHAERAVADHRAALALLERVVGPQHPDCAVALTRLAEARSRLGQHREALADLARAAPVVDRALGPETPAAARVLAATGQVRLRLGAAAAAVAPLEHAVRIRAARRGDPRELAEARFLLARALWASGGDRDRARRLAAQARETYAAHPWFREPLAAVDAWIASVTRPGAR